MRRTLVGIVVGVVALLVLVQLFLPAFLEERVESRITEDGGSADVSLSAFPAVRLLFGDGDRFQVRGRGLRFVRGRGEQVLSHLDGFDEVSLKVDDLTVDPVRASHMSLTRSSSDQPYRLDMKGQVTARDAVKLLGSEAGGPLGGIAGGIAGSALPGGDAVLPLTVDSQLESRGGRARVLNTNATVAGLPAGPLAEIVVSSVVSDL